MGSRRCAENAVRSSSNSPLNAQGSSCAWKPAAEGGGVGPGSLGQQQEAALESHPTRQLALCTRKVAVGCKAVEALPRDPRWHRPMKAGLDVQSPASFADLSRTHKAS